MGEGQTRLSFQRTLRFDGAEVGLLCVGEGVCIAPEGIPLWVAFCGDGVRVSRRGGEAGITTTGGGAEETGGIEGGGTVTSALGFFGTTCGPGKEFAGPARVLVVRAKAGAPPTDRDVGDDDEGSRIPRGGLPSGGVATPPERPGGARGCAASSVRGLSPRCCGT